MWLRKPLNYNYVSFLVVLFSFMLLIYLIFCFPSFPPLLLYLFRASVFLLSHLFLKQPFLPHDTDICTRSLVPALSFRSIMPLFLHVSLFCLKNCVKFREMLVALYTASQTVRLTCLCHWYLHLLLGMQQLLARKFRMSLCCPVNNSINNQPDATITFY